MPRRKLHELIERAHESLEQLQMSTWLERAGNRIKHIAKIDYSE